MALQTHFSDLKPYFPAQYQGVSDLQTTARGFHPSLHQTLPYNGLYIPSVPDAVHALPLKLHVAGRYEMIKKQDTPTVIIDYAHTPDALEKLLFAIRKSGRYQNLFTVFGCGGDRDFSKRSSMGRISQQFSDFSVVTSDNPRTEDPMQIIKDIEEKR